MKPQLSDEKIDICDELSELGFPSMANSLEYENPGIEEKQYYLADLDRAAAENTEEELPESVYFQVKSLIGQFFEMPNEDQMLRMSESKLRSTIRRLIVEGKPKLVPTEPPSYSSAIKKAWTVMVDGERIGELTKIDKMERDGRDYTSGFARVRGWECYAGKTPFGFGSRSRVFRKKAEALDWLMSQ